MVGHKLQSYGTRFCHHCVSIAHRTQITCIVLVMARTKVWMTFLKFEGTLTVSGKFDNRVRRLRGPQVYKYPLVMSPISVRVYSFWGLCTQSSLGHMSSENYLPVSHQGIYVLNGQYDPFCWTTDMPCTKPKRDNKILLIYFVLSI